MAQNLDLRCQHLRCWGHNTSRIQTKEIYATLCLQALQRMSRPKEIVGPGVNPMAVGQRDAGRADTIAPPSSTKAELSLQHTQYTCLENCGQVRVAVTRDGMP